MGPSRLSGSTWENQQKWGDNIFEFIRCFPLYWGFFELKTPRIVGDCLGDHFARVESAEDQNLTMCILHFHVFVAFSTPQKSHGNRRFPLPLQIKDSWDHAQMIEREILFRIALTRALYDQIRPSFCKNTFPILIPQYRPKPRPPIWSGYEMKTSPPEKREPSFASVLVTKSIVSLP